jgi:hypothetical protein
MDPFTEAPARRHQTRAEQSQAMVEASARAWAAARAKVADWPADLAARELEQVAAHFGGEPGTAADATTRQAEAMRAAVPRTSEVERPPVSTATAESARRLLAGTQSPEAEEAARAAMRPPR